MRTTTPHARYRTATTMLSTVLIVGSLSAVAVAQEEPSPDPTGVVDPSPSVMSLTDETPAPDVLVEPDPTPKPTPLLNGGTWVPSVEAPRAMIGVSRLPDYAGWFLDPDRDLMPVLMWTGDLDEVGAILAERFGDDATFEVRPAEHTWEELKQIADQVFEMRDELDERGILLVETGSNAKRNRVDVGIFAKEKKQAVAERMLAEFGDAVRVRRVNVPQFDS